MAGKETTSESTTPAKPRRGLFFYFIIVIIALLISVGGWFASNYFKKPNPNQPSSDAGGTNVAGVGKTNQIADVKPKKSRQEIPRRLPVPLVPDKLEFIRKVPGQENSFNMIVSTNSKFAKFQKITVVLADTKRPRYAMAQIFLAGDDTGELLDKLNRTRPAVYQKITNLLSLKTAKETQSPDFRFIVRQEILRKCNEILGSNIVQEVIIPEFVIQ